MRRTLITLLVNFPIDRQIQSWATTALPSGWQAIRDRWEFYHGLRTVASLAALACLFASTLSTVSCSVSVPMHTLGQA